MKSRNRVLSSILSCLTCLGSVGSAAKSKPAAPPAGEARRKKGNGGNKKGDRNAKGIVGIVPGTSTTTPRSGLSGRDIGFLAGGAAVGGFGGYFLGKKLSGNKSNWVRLPDAAVNKVASTLCKFGVSNDEAVSFIKAITNANVVLPSSSEIMKDGSEIMKGEINVNVDVSVVFDKNFDSGVGNLTFNVGLEIVKENFGYSLVVTCSDNEGVHSYVRRTYYGQEQEKRQCLIFGLVAAVFRKCYPKITAILPDQKDPVTGDYDFQECAEILALGFEIKEETA